MLRRKVRGHSIRHFAIPSVHLSVIPQEVGTLCMELLLQFYSDCFETLNLFGSWSEDVHIVWTKSSDYFLSLFSQNELRYLVYASPPTVLC